jgi:hypothetical protein
MLHVPSQVHRNGSTSMALASNHGNAQPMQWEMVIRAVDISLSVEKVNNASGFGPPFFRYILVLILDITSIVHQVLS